MTKEELLSEMYRLVNRFDRDILQLMNMLRENGELNDEINVSESSRFDGKGAVANNSSFEPEVGVTYDAIVTRIIPIGAFVEFAPGKEGLVHISKLREQRTERVEDVVAVGDTVRVKYLGQDEKGRRTLSMKDAD